MTHAGHARNFECTLVELAARGHEVHVAVDRTWKKSLPDLGDLLQSIVDRHPNVSSSVTPRRPKGGAGEVALRARSINDYLRYLDSDAYADAPKPRERAASALPPQLRGPRLARALERPLLRHQVSRVVRLIDESAPLAESLRGYIAAIAPDLVLVTPLVELRSPQAEHVRCARAMGIPVGLLVASWDNLTMKGGLHEAPDFMCVWNTAQAAEAERLHGFPRERIIVSGAVAYDHWFEWRESGSYGDFCRRVGLDPARPYVLYLGSSSFIAPNEAAFLSEWQAELARHQALSQVQVLVRPHPTNPLGSSETGAAAGVVRYPPNGRNPTNGEARADYFDSLFHASAVVGVNTSGFIESAIVDRPVHTILTPRYRDTQRGTLHFHHLTQERGGHLFTATSYAQHLELLAATIEDPTEAHVRNRAFVASFVRPRGLDRRASEIAVDEIERVVGAPSRPGGDVSRTAASRLAGRALGLPLHAALKYRVHQTRRRKRSTDGPKAMDVAR